MARKAGLGEDVVTGLSGHSPKVGAVQDMLAPHVELPTIIQGGRWMSTTMVCRYNERALPQRIAGRRSCCIGTVLRTSC